MWTWERGSSRLINNVPNKAEHFFLLLFFLNVSPKLHLLKNAMRNKLGRIPKLRQHSESHNCHLCKSACAKPQLHAELAACHWTHWTCFPPERMTDRQIAVIQTSAFVRHFLKPPECTCRFQKPDWQSLLPVIKFMLSYENENIDELHLTMSWFKKAVFEICSNINAY